MFPLTFFYDYETVPRDLQHQLVKLQSMPREFQNIDRIFSLYVDVESDRRYFLYRVTTEQRQRFYGAMTNCEDVTVTLSTTYQTLYSCIEAMSQEWRNKLQITRHAFERLTVSQKRRLRRQRIQQHQHTQNL